MAAREYRNITGQTVWVPDAQLSGGISKVEADGIFTLIETFETRLGE